MKPVVIVGNGLFGRTAAEFLKLHGIDNVTVIDDEDDWAGTRASGNMTKPTWLTSLPDNRVHAGYNILDAVYGLQSFHAQDVKTQKPVELFYVYRGKTLNGPHISGEALSINDGWLSYYDNASRETRLIEDVYILVAAGAWTQRLVGNRMPQIDPLAGVSFLFHSEAGYKAKVDNWAPYKQAISYQAFEDKVWFGDGVAIQPKNFSNGELRAERKRQSLVRAARQGLNENHLMETNFGLRPIVKGHKNGYFAQIEANTWVSTGGGKNGIVLAALQAEMFWQEIQRVSHT